MCLRLGVFSLFLIQTSFKPVESRRDLLKIADDDRMGILGIDTDRGILQTDVLDEVGQIGLGLSQRVGTHGGVPGEGVEA